MAVNATAYKIAPAWNNEAGFTDFSTDTLGAQNRIKPPKCPVGIQYPQYIHVGDGSVKGKGVPFVVWEWEDLDADEYDDLLTAFGLDWTAAYISRNVTVAMLTDRNAGTFTNYNGIVVHIKAQDTLWAGKRFQSARFLIKLIETT